MLTTAQVALDSLSNPNISNFLSKNSIDFTELRKRKVCIFFQIKENKLQHYSFILNIFYSQLFHFCMEDMQNIKMPIFCLLDEF
jgi:type IV secretory pathway TraG/TraD family ATPase VirD4